MGPRIAQFVDPKAVKRATSQAASDPMVCGVLYFVHIPKTGGTTINDRLRGLGWAFNRLYWGDEEEGDDPNAWLKDQDAWKKSDGSRKKSDGMMRFLLVFSKGSAGVWQKLI